MLKVPFGKKLDDKAVVALGFFDSVHIGHRAILEAVKSRAKALGAKPFAFTFRFVERITCHKDFKQVYSFDERTEIFSSLGIEGVIYADFDCKFMRLGAREFLDGLMLNGGVVGVCHGDDYRFGCGASGDSDFLKTYCSSHRKDCTEIGEVTFKGSRVSTTAVKNLLSVGNIERANALLSTPYHLTARVVHGRNVGHLFGIPTANTAVSETKFLPADGVYGTYTFLRGTRYKSVTNIGAKPTFGEQSRSVETLIEGVTGDLYDETVTVQFITRLRDVVKFDTTDALAVQIRKDAEWRENA